MDNVERKTVIYSGVPASAHGVEFVNYANVGKLPPCGEISEKRS